MVFVFSLVLGRKSKNELRSPTDPGDPSYDPLVGQAGSRWPFLRHTTSPWLALGPDITPDIVPTQYRHSPDVLPTYGPTNTDIVPTYGPTKYPT